MPCLTRVSLLRPNLFLAILISGFTAITSSCHKEEYYAFGKYQLTALPSSVDLTDLVFFDAQTIIAVGGNVWDRGVVCSSKDGGRNWQVETELPGRVEAVACSGGTCWAVGQNGGIYRKEQDHTIWTTLSLDYQRWYRGICLQKHAFIVNGEGFRFGRVLRWEDQGTRADTVFSCPNELSDISYVNDSTMVAVGYGYVVRSDSFGKVWKRLDLRHEFFKAIDFADSRHGSIAAENGHIYTTTDGGTTWKLSAKLQASLTDICHKSPLVVYACGLQGAIYRSVDGAKNWQRADQTPDIDWLGLKAGQNKIHLVGKGGHYLQADE